MHKIDVLMATYNGAKYLRAQLDSILAQERVEARIIIRDDGSTDATIAVISEYMQRFPGRIVLVDDEAPRAGARANFFRLLARESDADYFAFSDQDDVWLPRKLICAIESLSQAGMNVPAVFCSGYTLVDEHLHRYGQNPPVLKEPQFGNALIENIAGGMATVINRALWQLIRGAQPDESRIIMHDWWSYLVGAAFGKVYYTPEQLVLYRQHSRNVEGAVVGGRAWIRRLQLFFVGHDKGKASAQMRYFYELYGASLAPEKNALLRDVFFSSTRMPAFMRLLRRNIYRMRGMDDLMMAVRILLGRL